MSELADFVLNAFRRVGGIVETPAYGIYETLLPEEFAHRWGVSAYQRLAFADEATTEIADSANVTVISYGHPLVEMLIAEVRAEPACAFVSINELRLDKRGLFELARKALAFPNARLSQTPHPGEATALCHAIRFNFRAALVTDEKRERLVSVVMDAQAGFAVPQLAHAGPLTPLEEESAFRHLLPAPVRWLPGKQSLDRSVLDGLLERATHAAMDELAAPLETLRRFAARHLELDQARLNSYYDDIVHDLQRRIERADDPVRRATLESKVAAAQSEREAKLADAEAKYRLRVELELINLQVIVQPKILLPVTIGHRNASVERVVVWDPLLHRIEPLACDVCGRAATRLTLCNNGHLAHEDCLLPEQCVDCKRVYCRLCAEQIGRCAVCDRPVCQHSLNRCAVCQRATCREHVGLCHAADGQPARLPPPAPPQPATPPPAAERTEPKPASSPPPRRAREKAATTPATRAPQRTMPKPAPALTPYKIEVYAEPDAPVVNAFVMTQGQKQIAVRSWQLFEEGIGVTCRCEKRYFCPVHGDVLKPADAAGIEAQIEAQVDELRREYNVPARRVFRYAVLHGTVRPVPHIMLRGQWKAER